MLSQGNLRLGHSQPLPLLHKLWCATNHGSAARPKPSRLPQGHAPFFNFQGSLLTQHGRVGTNGTG